MGSGLHRLEPQKATCLELIVVRKNRSFAVQATTLPGNWNIQAVSGQSVKEQCRICYHKSDRLLDEHNPLGAKDVIDIHLTLGMIYSILTFAVQFYKKIGYWGTVKINVTFDQIIKKKLFLDSPSRLFMKNEFDNEITIERNVAVFELAEKVDEMVVDISREILWSFGARASATAANLIKILETVKTKLG
jgi:hypothetical protein